MITLIGFCGFPWWLKWLLPFLFGLLGGWSIWSKKNNYSANVSGSTSGKVAGGVAAAATGAAAVKASGNGELNKIKAELESCKKRGSSLEGDLSNSKKKVRKLEKEIEELKAKKSTSKAGLGSAAATAAAGLAAGAAISKKDDSNWNHASARVDDKEQIKTLKASLDSLRSKNNDLSTKFENAKKAQDDLKLKNEDLEKEVLELKGVEEAAEAAPKVNVEEYEAKISAYESKLAKSQEDIDNLKSRYSNVDREINKAEREATEWKIKYNALKQQKGGLKGDVVGTSAIVAGAGSGYVSSQVIEKKESSVNEDSKTNAPAASNDSNSAEATVDSVEKQGAAAQVVESSDQVTSNDSVDTVVESKEDTAIDSTDLAATGAAVAGVASLAGNNVSDASSDKTIETTTTNIDKKSPFDRIEQDNLQIIEGVGPKMEEVLKENGIVDFASLASRTPEELKSILDKYDGKYKIIDPSSWPQQAGLANKSEFTALIQLQKDLDGGNAETAVGETDSKLEKYLIKVGALKRYKQDDLKAIEGIGPKLEEIFHAAGIKTWKELSETPQDRLKEILTNAGSRFALAVPDTWPKQARMADEGKWDELEAYQDYLDGGKEPS